MARPDVAEYIDALIRSSRFAGQVAGHHYFPGRPATWQDPPEFLHPKVWQVYRQIGIRRLYSHQVQALSHICNGRHTVIATPTASGKSLVYNSALVDAASREEQARSLFVYPLKALARDQLAGLLQWFRAALPLEMTAAVYDGDISAYQRKKIRNRPPNAVLTNPEMLHLALLPHHAKWSRFFSALRLVVIDEVHTYRGITGAHMAQVLRRLQRICRYYGGSPTFVFTSATVANPGDLATQLSGLPVEIVDQSGSGQGGRHGVLIDPSDSPANTAILLLKAALARDLRTIVYTQSRRAAELVALWAGARTTEKADKISVYRAGLMPEERRRIENQLKKGDLLAVVSTSALELGIDVGDLDLCILIGYPGSMVATWQRSGRVGRKGQESAMILIASQDALDHYFITNPGKLWQGQPEPAVVNPVNPVVLRDHLICAASELPLQAGDPWIEVPKVASVLSELERCGDLQRSADGNRWISRRRRPHAGVSIRGTGRSVKILDRSTQSLIGELDGFRLYRETHPGAVYLHQGRTYLIEEVDDPGGVIWASPARLPYYTRVRTDTDVSIIGVNEYKYVNNTKCYFGLIKVTDKVIGFVRVQTANGRSSDLIPLDVPPTVFNTESLWFDIPESVCQKALLQDVDLMGGLHALEHAAIGIMPLMVLADRNDLGGLSTPFHPQTGQAAVFIYDGLPGGAGLSREAYGKFPDLFAQTRQCIQRCACDSGCPACIHSPKCGSGNSPMDKQGALRLLDLLDEHCAPVAPEISIVGLSAQDQGDQTFPDRDIPLPTNFGVFDLETQLSAQEVGGWRNARKMRISCGVVYDSVIQDYKSYTENQVDQLIRHLNGLELVVGFNSRRFDYQVLTGYSSLDFNQWPTLDLLEEVYKKLGFRLSLDHLALHTLNVRKNGTGLDALRWWRQGRMDTLVDYCRMDVQITRDLFLFARKHGYLLYANRSGQVLRVPLPGLKAGC